MRTRTVIVLLTLCAAACTSFEMTPAQRLAFERWEQCKNAAPGVTLDHISPEGQISMHYRGTGSTAVTECLNEAARRQGLSTHREW